MELSWSHRSSYFPLLLFFLAFLGYYSSCGEATQDLVERVCSKSKDPSFCTKALESDPRSRTANLAGLCQISIDLSTTNAKSTQALVTSLGKKATDKISKEIYNTCLENYTNSISVLGDCTKRLQAGDYAGVNIKASAAQTEVDTCDECFKERKLSEPPTLTNACQKEQKLCNIILVTANMLQGN
ncbi:pectinesterase inhibitor-like [Coffea eugenioides]|uniref:pectinesterase inhibitor-like n=1 Tax=Coffea eugenioides TaxID=49369 RepID=UPI000F610A03|nr:pectinesterase inhibitor-like [Coffea eugenioides]